MAWFKKTHKPITASAIRQGQPRAGRAVGQVPGCSQIL